MLIYIKKRLTPFITPLVIFSFLLLTSCSTGIDNSSESKTDFSAEELFAGVYFANGPVADLIPEMEIVELNEETLSSAQYQEVKAFQNRILDHLVENNPEFLAQFKTEIQSGDHYRVNDIIYEGSVKILETASVLHIQELAKEEGVDKLVQKDFVSGVLNKQEVNELKTLEGTLSLADIVSVIGQDKIDQISNNYMNSEEFTAKSNQMLYAGVVAIAAAVAGVVVVVAQAVVYINFVETSMGPDPTAEKQSDYSLRSEQAINSIVTNLSV